MMKKIGVAIAGFVAIAAAYLFVPPPHQASAQFVDQLTYGGTSTGSVSGSTTSYAITIPNLSANPVGVVLRFIPNVTNVGPTQINVSGLGLVNVLRHSSIGNVAFSGGEFQAGELTCIQFNGTAYELSCNVDITAIGKTVEFRGSATPRGTLIEDGTCVSQTTYAALFSVIGTNYGSCSAGLFAVPDSRGTAFVALDGQGANGLAGRITTASCATPNAVGLCGSQTQTLTAAQIPVITGLNTNAFGVTLSLAAIFPGVVTGAFQGGSGANGFTNSGTTPITFTAASGSVVANAIAFQSTNTGGAAHPILGPSSLGRRAIKF